MPETEKRYVTTASSVEALMGQEGVQPIARAVQGVRE